MPSSINSFISLPGKRRRLYFIATVALLAALVGLAFIVGSGQRPGPQAKAPAPLILPPAALLDSVDSYLHAAKTQPVLTALKGRDITQQVFVVTQQQNQETIQEATAALPPADVELPHPKRASTPAWQRFALKQDLNKDKQEWPVVAIIIDDMGLNHRLSQATVALPGPLTLSYLPYGHKIQTQVNQAKAQGHEIMLHLPMQPLQAGHNPGPNALLTSLDNVTLQKRVSTNLAAFSGYVGVNNHMGSRFTQDARGMGLVMAQLAQEGFLFLDSKTAARTASRAAAKDHEVLWMARDLFLDHKNQPEAINRQLRAVERLARRQGHAIAIGHPRRATLRALGPWLRSLDDKQLRLVPISYIAERYYAGAVE